MRCDDCAPGFGCWDGSKPCQKKPIAKPPVSAFPHDAIRRTRDAVALVETLLARLEQNSDDAQLVANAVRAARPRRAAPAERWVAVKQTLMVGSTTARDLCRRFGLDPYEEVPARAACEEHP